MQISFFKNEDTCLIFSNFYFEKSFNKNKEISIKKKIPKNNMVNFFLSKYPVSISTVIFNKKIIKEHIFNEKYHVIGDFDFVMKTALSYQISGLNDPLVTVSIHEENATKKKFRLYVLELLDWYKNCDRKFLKFRNYKNYKFNIYYELAKCCLNEKKYRSLLIIFKILPFVYKIKITIISFIKLLKLN